MVDGQFYENGATFTWPVGSKHIVEAQSGQLPFIDPYDPTLSPGRMAQQIMLFTGWTDNTGRLNSSNSTILVTADPAVTTLTASYTVYFPVILQYLGGVSSLGDSCAAAAGGTASGGETPGAVTLAGICYYKTAYRYSQATTLIASAGALPGFVFDGWIVNQVPITSPNTSIAVTGPTTIIAKFEPAARVRFLTSPPGLKVMVDRAQIPTVSDPAATAVSACPHAEAQTVYTGTPVSSMCWGDLDLVPGSIHSVSAPSPQYDNGGRMWVFDSWRSDAIRNDTLTAGLPRSVSTATASFIRGAKVSFVVQPSSLKLNVDGKDMPSWTWTWGVNTKHRVVAAARQSDGSGNKYVFKGWSNGGDATQELTVPQSAADEGMRLVATYELDPNASKYSDLRVESTPSGLQVTVDGTPCITPCTVEKLRDTVVQVSAPAGFAPAADVKYEFNNWSDSGPAEHPVKLDTDKTLIANYTTRYRLSTESAPAGSATFSFDPPTLDGFFPANTAVSVRAVAGDSFRFGFWTGDLTGAAISGTVAMSAPKQLIAHMERESDTPGAIVENAAGQTPSAFVAPGSLISIFGDNLAGSTQVGPSNPLSQILGNVVVTAGERILPLMFVSPKQINALLPSDLVEGDYVLKVESPGRAATRASFTARRNAPGLMSVAAEDKLYALALHEDGSLITAASPARRHETITLYGTGFGPLTNHFADGYPFPKDPENPILDPVEVKLGSATFAPSWSGAAPGYVGLTSVRFAITDDLPRSATLPMTVVVNGAASNSVLLPLE